MLLDIARRLRSAREDEDGFTIIEVMVAMTIFALIAAGIAAGITASLVVSKDSRAREIASTYAMDDIDALRDKDSVFDIKSGTDSRTVGGMTYSLTRSVTWTRSSGTSNACGTGTGSLSYKAVTETVSWRTTASASGTQSLTMSTAIAPLSNINSDTTGSILIGVTNAAGTGVSGITPTVTGPSGVAMPATDAEGCSYVTGVTPGTYTVQISRSGWIDSAQKSPSSQSVSVVAGGSGGAAFSFDTAATYAITYGNANNVSATLPTNLPATLINPTSGTVTLKNAASSASLFPFTAGYRAVAGTYAVDASGTASTSTCVDTEPGSWTTANAAGKKGVATQPSASPLSVQMGVVTLNNLPANEYLTATTATPASGSGDPGCAVGMTLTFPKTVGTSATVALPWGTWKISSNSTPGSTSGGLNLVPTVVSLLTNGAVSNGNVMLDPRAAS